MRVIEVVLGGPGRRRKSKGALKKGNITQTKKLKPRLPHTGLSPPACPTFYCWYLYLENPFRWSTQVLLFDELWCLPLHIVCVCAV